MLVFFFFKQKTAYEIRISTGVQTCALPISSSSTGFSSAYVAFVLPAVIGLKQNVGRLVSGLGQQGRDLREGARDIGSRSPRLDVFQFIVISDTRDLHPGSVGGLGEGLDLHHLPPREADRSEEHTSELQSLMRNTYADFCLSKKTDERKNDKE